MDIARRELRRHDAVVSLEPQVFDLIAYLAMHRDRVVSRDELIQDIWGGRIVSESTLTSRISAARRAVGDSGARQGVIRTIARKGFRLVADVEEHAISSGATTSSALTSEPDVGAPDSSFPSSHASIAVLAFRNSTGDPDQDYFSDGISEDIIAALSRFGWLCVMARSSSFFYKGRVVDIRQIRRELGVRYVLDGSVRRAETRVRIAAHLVDADRAQTIWARQFEGALDDVFDLQDQLTEAVVGAIGPSLEQAEMFRARQKPTQHLDAHDLYLQGLSNTYSYTEPSYRKALSLFRRSLELDPEHADAFAMAAWCFVTCYVSGWMTDPEDDRTEGIEFARRALEKASDNPVPLCWGGFCLAWLSQDFGPGVLAVERALTQNPNLAAGWYLSGWLGVYCGHHEIAIPRFERALKLSPLDPLMFRAYAGIGHAHFFLHRFEEARSWVLKAATAEGKWLTAVRGTAACHAMTGNLAEARDQVELIMQLDPSRRVSNLENVMPLSRPQDRDLWREAFRRAGLPD